MNFFNNQSLPSPVRRQWCHLHFGL